MRWCDAHREPGSSGAGSGGKGEAKCPRSSKGYKGDSSSRADAKPGYTTYTNFSQVMQASDAQYPAITRVSDPGSSEHPVYTGFFFYQCLQFDATGRYLLGMRVYFDYRAIQPTVVPILVLSISKTITNGPGSEKQQPGTGSKVPGFNAARIR